MAANGILILAHGSKRQETEAIMDSIVEQVKGKTGLDTVLAAYLQFSELNLEKGIEMLAGNGAKSISVIPMFIFDGVHVTSDIPEELEQIRKKYPDVKIKISRHIGDDEKLADIVVDRINSISQQV